MRWDAPTEAFVDGELVQVAKPAIRRLVRSLLVDAALCELANSLGVTALQLLIGLATLVENTVESRHIAAAVLGKATASPDVIAFAGCVEPELPDC